MPSSGFWYWCPMIAISVCWGMFALAWLVGAIHNIRRAPAARERATTPLVWLLGIAAYLVLRWVLPATLWNPVTIYARWLVGVGVIVLVAGTGFTLWARAVLGTMWTATAVVKDDHVLRTDGPYAITRHPIYTGLLAMLTGTALIQGLGVWIAVLALAVVLVGMKIRTEERLLERALGTAYRDYRRRVPQLLPTPRRHG